MSYNQAILQISRFWITMEHYHAVTGSYSCTGIRMLVAFPAKVVTTILALPTPADHTFHVKQASICVRYGIGYVVLIPVVPADYSTYVFTLESRPN